MKFGVSGVRQCGRAVAGRRRRCGDSPPVRPFPLNERGKGRVTWPMTSATAAGARGYRTPGADGQPGCIKTAEPPATLRHEGVRPAFKARGSVGSLDGPAWGLIRVVMVFRLCLTNENRYEVLRL